MSTASVTSTAEHPFWNEPTDTWTHADDLGFLDYLRSSTGERVLVIATSTSNASLKVYNLTVGDLHTYYVLAGSTPVLVHNDACDVDVEGIGHAKDRHLQSGPEWDPDAGYFDPGTDFGALAKRSAGQIGIRQPEG